MRALRRFVRRLAASALGRRDDERLQEELAAHLALLTEEYARNGLPPEEARRRAVLRLGSHQAVAEACRDEQRLRWLENLGADLRAAFRAVRRYPVAATVAVASLGAGIGATTITLTVRDAVFRNFPPLYYEPHQLSRVQVDAAHRVIHAAGSSVPVGLYNTWADTRALEIAASASRGTREARAGDRIELIAVRMVTSNTFELLGVAPIAGSGFAASANGAQPVVLSYRAWQRLFDGRRDAVGQVLWIDNQAHTVAGVMPERFWLADMSPAVWTLMSPRTLAPGETLETIVRRPAGVSPAGLEAQLRAGLDDYARRQPAGSRLFNMRISGVEGTPLGHQLSIVVPYILAVAVLLTLLIACANVAVLMFAQWTARDREIAIRASIGASRGRIVQTLLTESMLIALSGGVLGLGVALVLRAMVAHNSDELALYDLSIQPAAFLEVSLITVLTGIVTGIMPALYETHRLHADPLRALRGSDRVRQRLRHGLVVFEIAVTVALLVATAAMIDGYRRARQADMGFETQPLMTARIESRTGVRADDVLRVASGLPGVVAAAASTSVPFGASGAMVPVSSRGDSAVMISAEQAAVRGPFFAALGVPIVAGRTFADDAAPTQGVVVNEALARRLFADGNALGATVWISSLPHDVVGIARDYASNPFRTAADEPRVFVPLQREPMARRLQLIVRTANDPAPLVRVLRRDILRSVPDAAVSSADTFEQVIRVMSEEMLVASAPLFPLISIGMLLTTAGIYGVLAFAISRRARELAVRVAVGASPRDLVWGVTQHTLRLVALGTGVGVLATYGLARIVRANGGAGSIYDPALHAFAMPVAAIVLVGLIATWLPARRAASIDPATLLRTD